MRVALDTNILVYAEGLNDAARKAQARDLLSKLVRTDVVLPVQVAGELFRVLVRKARRTPAEARLAVEGWQELFGKQPTTPSAFESAMILSSGHGLDIWDTTIIAVAAEGGCHLLLSEDLADGFSWRGVTIANPFAQNPNPLLRAL
jgi:predicted nucleic acid-binding protein